MNNFPFAIVDGTDNFVTICRPVAGFNKCQLALDAVRPVSDQQLAVLVHPPLAAEQVMHTSRHFIPAVMIVEAF